MEWLLKIVKDRVQQDLDEDLSEQLKNLIMESQRSRADWDQRKALLPPEDVVFLQKVLIPGRKKI